MITPEEAAGRFRALLEEACLNVKPPWYSLPHHDYKTWTTKQTFRERVYCYELYHQIRVLQDRYAEEDSDGTLYQPSGEIDKRGIRPFKELIGVMPDLVWHVPGEALNAAVVEVKRARPRNRRGIGKDIDTLTAFLTAEEGPYFTGILLFYGDVAPEEVVDAVLSGVGACRRPERLTPEVMQRIQLLHHQGEAQRVVDLGTLAMPRRPAAWKPPAASV